MSDIAAQVSKEVIAGWPEPSAKPASVSPNPFVAAPRSSDLYVQDSSKVAYHPAVLSRKVKRFTNHVADNPQDFLFSLATSVAVFAVVRMAVGGAIAMAGLSALATPIMVTMLAAGLIGLYRGSQKAKEESQKQVAALYEAGGRPTPQQLEQAHEVEVSTVINSGLKHALISGILGSIIGAALSGDWPEISEYYPKMNLGSEVGDVVTTPADVPVIDEVTAITPAEEVQEVDVVPVDSSVERDSLGTVTPFAESETVAIGTPEYIFDRVTTDTRLPVDSEAAFEIQNELYPSQHRDFFNMTPEHALKYFFNHSTHLDHFSVEQRKGFLKVALEVMEKMNPAEVDEYLKVFEDKDSFIYKVSTPEPGTGQNR